jgi:3D (Asp-Asp-Asp) domain-containing protein
MGRALRVVFICFALAAAGCFVRDLRLAPVRPAPGVQAKTVRMVVTGYCPCGECCGWRRTWYGRPVIASGPRKGRTKAVGYTASGAYARPGTVAADAALYPFGAVVYVPGYGYGRVEDRGGDIKGQHIDLFFRRHADAEAWGRKVLDVKVWQPGKR